MVGVSLYDVAMSVALFCGFLLLALSDDPLVPNEVAYPEYVEIARKARITGEVSLRLEVNRRGRVTQVEVLQGLPMGLSDAAVDAAEQWRFPWVGSVFERRHVSVSFVFDLCRPPEDGLRCPKLRHERLSETSVKVEVPEPKVDEYRMGGSPRPRSSLASAAGGAASDSRSRSLPSSVVLRPTL